MLNITERQTRNATILDLEGNIIMGGGSNKYGQEIRRLLEEGKTNVLLNFQSVRYIDSSGIGELISSSQLLNKAGGSLKLYNLPKKVEEVIALSSVLPILEVCESESEALNGS